MVGKHLVQKSIRGEKATKTSLSKRALNRDRRFPANREQPWGTCTASSYPPPTERTAIATTGGCPTRATSGLRQRAKSTPPRSLLPRRASELLYVGDLTEFTGASQTQMSGSFQFPSLHPFGTGREGLRGPFHCKFRRQRRRRVRVLRSVTSGVALKHSRRHNVQCSLSTADLFQLTPAALNKCCAVKRTWLRSVGWKRLHLGANPESATTC